MLKIASLIKFQNMIYGGIYLTKCIRAIKHCLEKLKNTEINGEI